MSKVERRGDAPSQDKAARGEARSRYSRTRPRSFLGARAPEPEEDDVPARTPERALMLAILEDAVACYAGKLKAPRENPRILRRQAAYWLSSEDWDSPFSFNNVCEALALDPRAIRERVLSSEGVRIDD